MGDEIGRGQYAIVYKAMSIKYNIQFAAKVFDLSRKQSEKLVGTFLAEIKALCNLSHPNIISIYDHFVSNDYLFLILEYCPDGNLFEYLGKNGKLGEDKSILIFRQLLETLSFMHEKKLCHSDIKPANILIDKYGRLKFSDFGLSAFIDSQELKTEFIGSFLFMAPEQILKKAFDPMKADVWSLGVTFYMMMTGESPWPYNSKSVLEKAIISGMYQIPENISTPYAILFSKMLQVDPKKRMSVDDLLKLPLFNQYHISSKSEGYIGKLIPPPPLRKPPQSFTINKPTYQQNKAISFESHRSFMGRLSILDLSKKRKKPKLIL